MSELEKNYNIASEGEIYTKWEESGFFNPDNCVTAGIVDPKKPVFSVLMPPPNVTGILHLGHAMENSLMDIEARFHRMKGEKTLFLPGVDHAAVATQAKVEAELMKQGIKNPRAEFSREGLLVKIREYAESSKEKIIKQIKRLGSSCDWSRLAYTFDEKRSKIVFELFKKMYDDGLIYRGSRMINWDPKLQTTISDDEIVWEEETVPFYYLQYGPFVIATARPETKFGDKYVVMHPDDERYQKYNDGDQFECEWLNGKITATVIKDEAIDREFGTGVMTITPYHDLTDFEIAKRHDLVGEQIIDFQGKLLPIAGEFAGMDILEARPKIAEKLKAKGLLVKVEENYVHRVAHGDRSKGMIEPQVKEQWFVDVNKKISAKNKSLKELMREAVTVGLDNNKDKKVNIIPERFKDAYLKWIDNLRDWCISRQIWWGHRIPIWYRSTSFDKTQDKSLTAGKDVEQMISEENPGEGWEQDPDTLDTWFSSGAWTFSTLQGEDRKVYHPTTWMQMGYEILFFWLARMILMTAYYLDEIPFKDVYIHGMLRDKDGKKFSKSLGNGIDPIEMSEKYGADALRLALLANVSPGNDACFYEEKVEHYRNFINKLWNISRFILGKDGELKMIAKQLKPKTEADKWLLSRLTETTNIVTEALENYKFSLAIDTLYDFTWSDFADWYLEIAKVEGEKEEILHYVLPMVLKLWQPFAPFVTQTIWEQAGQKDLLMVSSWPVIKDMKDEEATEFIVSLQQVITALRTYRADNKISMTEIFGCYFRPKNFIKEFNSYLPVIERLARVKFVDEEITNGSALIVSNAILKVEQQIKKASQTEIIDLKKYIAQLEAKLANEEFTGKAPAMVIQKEQTKLMEAKDRLAKLE